jgi:hypothetical protein
MFLWILRFILSFCLFCSQIRSGYRIGNIGEQNKQDDRNFTSPLGDLEEVTKENLIYDLEDARRFKVRTSNRAAYLFVESMAVSERQDEASAAEILGNCGCDVHKNKASAAGSTC